LAVLAKNIGEGADLVHAHQRRLVRVDMPLLQDELFGLGGAVEEGDRLPVAAPAASEGRFGAALDQMVVPRR
jgi:hypothetical protein